ncbi:hypothetical protein BGZ76_010617 [Entomortierella beljakovae]|nr:hypothetical protein BGZ76_010617 [Entomortierella beljakovae]
MPVPVHRTDSAQSLHYSRSTSFSSSSFNFAAGQRNNSSTSLTSTSSSTPSTTNTTHKNEPKEQQQQQSEPSAPERTMGLMSAILMIIGTLIGTGIFASPGPLFDSVHSTPTSFMIWGFAGIVCTIGAFAYVELGTMFPESGGDFQYLARAYGKKMALVFGWSYITILNPIGTAGNAGVLGRYVVDVIVYFKTGTSTGAGTVSPSGYGQSAFNTTEFPSLLNGTGFNVPHIHSPYAPGTTAYASIPKTPLSQDLTGAVLPTPAHSDEMPWVVRSLSIVAIILIGLINIFFKEGGKITSNILAIFKVAGMCMLIVIGSLQAAKNHAQSEALSVPIGESSQNVLDYVSALCFAFFAFNGFNNINLGLGELKNPEKNLKRAVWIAMPFVTVLFLLANFAFFSILSSYDLRHVHSLSLHAGHTVLGQPGGLLMAGTVIASALGSINANVWAGSRLLVMVAKDNAILPSSVGKAWKRTGTHSIAIIILVVQASTHGLINLDFKTFSKIYSAVGWTWYGLSVAGLLYMRISKPSFPRPVRVYWPLALFFVLIAFFLVFGSLTLAFMGGSTSQPTGNGAEEEVKGVAKYMSIIMFGMAILFMVGVIPAYYLTQCYNRRRSHKNGSKVGDISRPPMYDQSDEDIDRELNIPSVTVNLGGKVSQEYGTYQSTLGVDHIENPFRRGSVASSVTLVDSRRKKKDHPSLRDQYGCRPYHINRSESRSTTAEDDEEEIARAQALANARISHEDGLLAAEIGANHQSRPGFYATRRPSLMFNSPTTPSSSGSFTFSPNASTCSLNTQGLELPRDMKSVSSSSATTLGLEGHLSSKKHEDAKEESNRTNFRTQNTEVEVVGRIEELNIDESRSDSHFLEAPSQPTINSRRIVVRQNTETTITNDSTHDYQSSAP